MPGSSPRRSLLPQNQGCSEPKSLQTDPDAAMAWLHTCQVPAAPPGCSREQEGRGQRLTPSPSPTPGLTTGSCCTTPPSASCPGAGAWAPSASWRLCRYRGGRGTGHPLTGVQGLRPSLRGPCTGRLHPGAAERRLGAALRRGHRLGQSCCAGQREAPAAGTGGQILPHAGHRPPILTLCWWWSPQASPGLNPRS